MSAVNTGIPDLLQRFVPTPHTAVVAFSDTEIAFQSNDKDLIASLERAGTRTECPSASPPQGSSRAGLCRTCGRFRHYRHLHLALGHNHRWNRNCAGCRFGAPRDPGVYRSIRFG